MSQGLGSLSGTSQKTMGYYSTHISFMNLDVNFPDLLSAFFTTGMRVLPSSFTESSFKGSSRL